MTRTFVLLIVRSYINPIQRTLPSKKRQTMHATGRPFHAHKTKTQGTKQSKEEKKKRKVEIIKDYSVPFTILL